MEKSKIVHNDKYDYSKVNYVNSQFKVIIRCPIHGDFDQKPSRHVSGQGCPICGYSKNVFMWGWQRQDFIDKCKEKNKEAILYLMYLTSDTESFFKIGITSRTCEIRSSKIPYEMNPTVTLHSFDYGLVFDVEQELKKVLKEYSYKPNKKFGGHTECYTLDKNVMNTFYEYLEKFINI